MVEQSPQNPDLKTQRQHLSSIALSRRSIQTEFGLISPAEYYLFQELDSIGTFSRLQLLGMIPRDIMKNLIKHGMLVPVEHPTKLHFRVADGILED